MLNKEVGVLELLRHPNVLAIEGFFATSEASYLVTRYEQGGDLLVWLQTRGMPLDEATAQHYFRQLTAAVDYVHAQGFVHRDIKCENLLLSTDHQRLILADFGFATSWSRNTMLADSFGSLHYSSPEIVACLPFCGPEVDVWSMGVVLYAMCTLRLPFGGDCEEDIAARIVAGEFLSPVGLSSSLTLLLRSLLRVDTTRRISVAEPKKHTWVVGASNTCTSGLSVVPAAAAVLTPSPRRASDAGHTPRAMTPVLERRRTSAPALVIPARTSGGAGGGNLWARLSRYTASGVKQFSLSKLLRKKQPVENT